MNVLVLLYIILIINIIIIMLINLYNFLLLDFPKNSTKCSWTAVTVK